MHCLPRAVRSCCWCYAASFHHIQLLNEVTIGRGCSVRHRCKMAGVMLKCVPGVCFCFNRTCAFLQLWWRYLMIKVICFIDRRSTHRYHLFIWIIMNICNLAEMGTGNASLQLCLVIIYAKPKQFLCAAYSPREYYSSSQASVLLTTYRFWLLRSFITNWGLNRKMFFRDKQPDIFCRSRIYFETFLHHLLMLIKWATALGALAVALPCFVDQILTLQDLGYPSVK